jgi:sporulation protein YlmC with PRC-barrel domain/osmotically-inducible protein OsmY
VAENAANQCTTKSGMTQERPMESARKSVKATELLGAEVRNYQDEKLGKVEDIAVDVESGRIAQVILSSGGFAGIGDTLYAVPPGTLHYDTTKRVVHLDSNKAKMKAAPQFEMAKWNDSFDADHLAKVASHYNATKAPDDYRGERMGDSASASSRNGQFHKASKLLGMHVNSPQADKMGHVNNVLVNLSTGRVVAVVIASGGSLGNSDEFCAVPPTVLRITQDRTSLQLDASKESLASAPHFKSSQWPDFDEPTYATHLSRSFAGESYARPSAQKEPDNTARNIRDRDDKSLTPMDQGNGKADIDISARIRKQIMASELLSMNGKNVKIITRDAHVTLRGPTNSAEEKRLIGEIADRIAGNGNVDNQLEVKSASVSSL